MLYVLRGIGEIVCLEKKVGGIYNLFRLNWIFEGKEGIIK